MNMLNSAIEEVEPFIDKADFFIQAVKDYLEKK